MTLPILATKLYPPAPRAHLVPRPRLMARLSEGFARKLTLVSAPAGFGKTTLLSEWRAGPGREYPLAWLTLDESDNDPVRFWSYVMVALEKLLACRDDTAWALLQSSPPQIEAAVTAIVNLLATLAPPDLVLVLDDYQVIRSEAVNGSLAFFLDHLPPTPHVAILTRGDPALPLARLRARDQLVELRAADLRCTPEETIAFFQQAVGLTIAPDTLALLDARTEGWLAGLQLIALSLKSRDAAQIDQFIGDIAGTHHHILDYLTEEVLQNQPEEVRDFLLRTSILRQLHGALCEAVTGQPDGRAMLMRLEHDNLFTEPLDAGGQWYRYHRLFADVLYAQLLQQTPSELIIELHQRAKDWLARNGFPIEAMRHAVLAQQFDWAADLIEQQQRALVLRGELATLRGWLDALPGDLVNSRPRLSLAYAWASAYSGRYDAIERYLEQAERAAQALAQAEQVAVHGEVLALRAVIQSVAGDADHAIENARAALAQVPEDDPFLRMVAWHALGNGYRRLGRPLEAERALLQARSLGRPLNDVILHADVELRLGHVQIVRGHLRQAMHSFETTLQFDGQRGAALPNACEAYVRMGDIYREWNELDTALQQVNKGIQLGKRASNATALLSGYFTLMRVHCARGDLTAAHEALSQADQFAARYDFPYLAERVAAHRAWMDLCCGDHAAAEAWADDYLMRRASLRARAEFTTDLEDTLLVRILVEHGLAEAAQAILVEVRNDAEETGRVYTTLQTQVLEALTLEAQHQHNRALSVLAQALALAEPEGYVRLFVDEGEVMRSLLLDIRSSVDRQKDNHLADYLRKLLDAFPAVPIAPSQVIDHTGALYGPTGTLRSQKPHGGALRSENQNLIEPLTTREIEILRLLASGASNQQIADRLVIGIGTVKAHLNHIFGKLGAHNRVEAIARARVFGLLDEV